MAHERELEAASQEFLEAFSSNISPQNMVSYFSTTHPVIIQHAPASCTRPSASRLIGPNALRSYFDLLATHWIRSDVKIRSAPQVVDGEARSVILGASVTWMWRKSGRKWTEDFTWTIEFDEGLKIISLIIQTVSEARTCIMRATDRDNGTFNSNDDIM
ncbi:hypothetical protein BYT27DRAFT_7145152 [Phlegmacium glaucopus]|nr:hypothetical protein BYT27DRAFT_7145152 [Phlegmacium glaucopus]